MQHVSSQLSEHKKLYRRGFRNPLCGSGIRVVGDHIWIPELNREICRLALDKGAEYVNAQDEEGETALHRLSKAKDTTGSRFATLVNVLLSRGADLNLANCYGDRPLCLTIWKTRPIESAIQPHSECRRRQECDSFIGQDEDSARSHARV